MTGKPLDANLVFRMAHIGRDPSCKHQDWSDEFWELCKRFDIENPTDSKGMNTKTLHDLDTEIAELERQSLAVTTQLLAAKRERWRLKSVAFIEANNITRDDVELSHGDDRPWFETIVEFGKWLTSNSTKRFCEWNETIYFTDDIIAGRMDHDAPGMISELP